MSDEPIIRFQDVCKRFDYTADRPKTFLEKIHSLVSRQDGLRPDRDLWAVRNVTFDIEPGQSLGIIGRNGGGKSTILKLIARIIRPTSGRIIVRGRASALLELGAGFHPDLTGRENIFLNASLLGLGRSDIDACYQDVVDFSELGEFINMPVKHYSSGMYMRLGFSVAIHVNPDVLIVDEILAVGDQAFQKKCIDRIFDMINRGTTIVIVSHNMNMVRNLCSHLVWIERGDVMGAGPADEIAGQYVAFSHGQESGQRSVSKDSGKMRRWGSREIEITSVQFLDSDGKAREAFRTGETVTVEIGYVAHVPVAEAEFGMALYRKDGVHVSQPNTNLSGLQMGVVEGAGIVQYQIERLPLLPAEYVLTVAIYNIRSQQAYDHHERAYSLSVIPGGTPEIHGLIELPASWTFLPDTAQERVS